MSIPVREIEIKERLIDMDRSQGRYYKKALYKTGQINFEQTKGEEPKAFPMDVEEKTYEIVTWYGEDGKTNYFGVPVDQHKLFTELIRISEDMVRHKIDLEVEVKTSHFNMELKIAIETATETTIKYIAALPWWRRLFKAF